MTVVITPGRRAPTIRVRRLFECADYSSAPTIRVHRLFECADYSRAASDRANTVCSLAILALCIIYHTKQHNMQLCPLTPTCVSPWYHPDHRHDTGRYGDLCEAELSRQLPNLLFVLRKTAVQEMGQNKTCR